MAVLASVEVEVTGKLLPLEQAFEKGRQEAKAFEKDATASANKVADAVSAAADKVGKSASAAAGAEQALAKGLREASEEAKKLGLTQAGLELRQARLAKEADAAAKALEREAAAAKKAAAETAAMAKSSDDAVKALGAALEQITGAQIAEDAVKGLGEALEQITASMNPLEMLGNRVGGIGGTVLRVAASFGVLGGAVTAGAAVVAAGGYAWLRYDDSLQKAELSLYGIGRAAGLTTSEFMAMADGVAQAEGITSRAARDMAGAILQAGVSNTAILEGVTAATRDYAAVTGQEAASAARELGEAFVDPIQGLEMLESRLGLVDDKTRQHIISLTEQNRLTEAQAALLKVLQGEVAGAAGEVTGLAAAWRSVTTWATQAFEAMGKYIAIEAGTGTTGDRLNQARGHRNSWYGRAGAFVSRQMGGESTYDGQIRELEATQAREQADARAARARAERNRVDREGREALAALIPGERQRAQITAQIADVERAAAAGTISRADADKALAQARLRLNQIDRREAGPRGRKDNNNRAQQLAREAEAMKVNADSAIALAGAYLESAEAAVEAEARRTALTAATRRGTDVEAQAQRQLAINVANVAVAGAKSVATMREETAARRAANNSVIAGSQSLREANRWAEIDAAQRPLQNALIHAEGEARERLTEIIDAQADAIEALQKEQARAQALQQTEQLKDQTELLDLETKLIGAGNAERRIQIVQLQTLQRLRAMGLDPEDPAARGMMDAATANAQAENARELAVFMDRATQSTNNQIRAFRESAATIGMTYVEAERYRKEQELLNAATDAGIKLTDAQRGAIAQLADAYSLAAEELRQLEEQQRALQDATQFATDQFSTFFDEIIFGSGSAKDALRSLVRASGQAMLKGFLSGQGPLAGILGTQQQQGQLGGGVLGSIFGNLFKARVAHSGMKPGGEPASSRVVSPSLFVNAPRLHDGLKPDEFPAILQKGEGVTPKGHKSSGNVVYMTVNTPNADSFRKSDRQLGRSLKKRLSI